MPLYDYNCAQCGPFQAWRPISQASATVACPECETQGQRVVTAPFLNTMNPHTRIAHQRNEKSADQPRVMNRSQLDRSGPSLAELGHHHGPHHSHGHSASNRLTGNEHYQHSNKRWMVGH